MLCGRFYATNLAVGLFETEHLTNGDKYKEGQSVVETSVFGRIYILLSTTVVASVKGIYPHCSGQLHSLEQEEVLWYKFSSSRFSSHKSTVLRN